MAGWTPSPGVSDEHMCRLRQLCAQLAAGLTLPATLALLCSTDVHS